MLYIMSFIAMFETFTHAPQFDRAQWSVGYGTKSVDEMCITEEYAKNLLYIEAHRSYERVTSIPNLQYTQIVALTSFHYNIGNRAFTSSKLYSHLVHNRPCAAAKEFDKWIYSAGKKLSGLQNRRAAEKKMFMLNLKCK